MIIGFIHSGYSCASLTPPFSPSLPGTRLANHRNAGSQDASSATLARNPDNNDVKGVASQLAVQTSVQEHLNLEVSVGLLLHCCKGLWLKKTPVRTETHSTSPTLQSDLAATIFAQFAH
eukprot:3168561-Amphidinium_carterae.1